MPNKFPIKSCPLCNSALHINYPPRDGYGYLSGERSYYCPVVIRYEPPQVDGYSLSGTLVDGYYSNMAFKSHYEVVLHSAHGIYQSVILDDFMLRTGLNDTETKVYKFPNLSTCLDKFFIMKLPVLALGEHEKLAKRLKGLVIFS